MTNELLIKNAEEKLIREIKEVSGQKEKAMASAVKDALLLFCRQEPEFAQAITESKGSFKECMSAVAKGTENSISDIEAYKKAVQFYFPGADIKFHMTVELCGSVKEEKPKIMNISLFDLL